MERRFGLRLEEVARPTDKSAVRCAEQRRITVHGSEEFREREPRIDADERGSWNPFLSALICVNPRFLPVSFGTV